MDDDLTDIPTGNGDNIVTEFATYEDYLDSQISSIDLYYLEVGGIYVLICVCVLCCSIASDDVS